MARLFGVLLVVALAVAGYWYWTTTPEYAIGKIRESIKTGDVALFQKYVDVDSAASSIVDALVAQPLGDMAGPSIIGRLVGVGILSVFKPAIVAHMHKEILSMVRKGATPASPAAEGSEAVAPTAPSAPPAETPVNPVGGDGIARGDSHETSGEDSGEDSGDGPDEDTSDRSDGHALDDVASQARRRFSLRGALKHFGFSGKVMTGVEYCRRQDKLALVGLKLHNQKHDVDLTLEVAMRDMGGYWQAFELSNLPEFVGRLIELESASPKGDRQRVRAL